MALVFFTNLFFFLFPSRGASGGMSAKRTLRPASLSTLSLSSSLSLSSECLSAPILKSLPPISSLSSSLSSSESLSSSSMSSRSLSLSLPLSRSLPNSMAASLSKPGMEGSVSALKTRREGIPYSANTCGGGGPGGGPGGFFPAGKRGTPGTVANTGPEDADSGPLVKAELFFSIEGG